MLIKLKIGVKKLKVNKNQLLCGISMPVCSLLLLQYYEHGRNRTESKTIKINDEEEQPKTTKIITKTVATLKTTTARRKLFHINTISSNINV
jgi:hypothetical protein